MTERERISNVKQRVKRPISKQQPVRRRGRTSNSQDLSYSSSESKYSSRPKRRVSSTSYPKSREGERKRPIRRPLEAPKRNRPAMREVDEPVKKNKFTSILNGFFYFATIGIIIGVLFLTSTRDQEDGSVMGYIWYTVLTNSMAPSTDSPPGGFYAGDLVVVKKATIDELQVGDVVTSRMDNGTPLTHRVIKIDTSASSIQTKGDANNAADPPTAAKNIVGKVVFVIPKVGKIISILKSNWKLVVGILVFLWGLGFVWKFYRRKQYKKIEQLQNNSLKERNMNARRKPPRTYT